MAGTFFAQFSFPERRAHNMASVFDTAAYLLQKSSGTMEQMQLHKILYYCQGWNLGNNRGPLFPERIEAWVNGPVVPTLWEQYHHRYRINRIDDGNAARLTADELSFVDRVFAAYGQYDGATLSQFTHKEAPWIEAREGLDEWVRGDREITQESLKRYFGELIAHAQGTV